MLKGTDQSKWQPNAVAEGDFIIIKATEGVGYVDPTCDAKYQLNKKAGKLLGVYHFARPDLGNTAEAEAEYFVKNIQGYIGEAILVLDWERSTNNVAWAKAFLDKVYALTGVKPLIYMSASVVNGNNWADVVKGDYGLWIAGYPAKYNVKNPPTPTVNDMPYGIGAWKFWAIWQYSSSAGTLDLDIASMDAAAWKKYAAKAGSSSTTPATPSTPETPVKKSNEEIANEVIAGKWGNGADRKKRLTEAGYDYNAIQNIVNAKMGGASSSVVNYAVRRGDTLSSIAKAYGTTWQKIAADNNIANPNIIFPGQRLIIKK